MTSTIYTMYIILTSTTNSRDQVPRFFRAVPGGEVVQCVHRGHESAGVQNDYRQSALLQVNHVLEHRSDGVRYISHLTASSLGKRPSRSSPAA